jgi:hypothetical protein
VKKNGRVELRTSEAFQPTLVELSEHTGGNMSAGILAGAMVGNALIKALAGYNRGHFLEFWHELEQNVQKAKDLIDAECFHRKKDFSLTSFPPSITEELNEILK